MPGFDERLFGALWRRWRQRGHDTTPTTDLESVRAPLRYLAGLLAGHDVEILPAEFDGGVEGRTILLPERIETPSCGIAPISVWVFRIAYALTSRRLEFATPAAANGHGEVALAALLAVAPTLAALHSTHPGAAPLFERLADDTLGRRPDPSRMPPHTRLLEALHRRLLGESRCDHLGDDEAAWVERASRAHVDARNLAALHAELLADMPPAKRREGRIDLPLFGRLQHSVARVDRSPHAGVPQEPPTAERNTPSTERRGRTREHVEYVDVDQNPESMNPLAHVFEKLLTAEEYQGGRKSLDGSDELDEHHDALDELALRNVVRTPERADSLYRADIQLDADAAECGASEPASDPIAVYDEWDDRKRRYHRGWCRVFAHRSDPIVSAADAGQRVRRIRCDHAGELRAMHAALERIEREREPRNRQRDGSEVDVDAVVDGLAWRRAAESRGIATSDDGRFYIARRRHRADLATLILLDTSLSTDAWIRGRRVIDIARDSIVILGESLVDHGGIRTAVGSFFSNTRHACSFELVKDFDEPWRSSYARLLSLRPTGYTRIGPAIRHACALLETTPARKKLLLLVSDGKPTDYDRYEGSYGVGDVRQALREARRAQILAFALTVEKQGKLYLPQMFGPHGYRILPSPRDLPSALGELQIWLD